jgi:ammonia channel protein AmtB
VGLFFGLDSLPSTLDQVRDCVHIEAVVEKLGVKYGLSSTMLFSFYDSGYNIVGEGAVTTGRVAVVTCLGGAMGAVSLLAFVRMKEGVWNMMVALNGLIAGMIATCSGCNVMQPWASLIVGMTGAFVFYGQSWVTENILHIDDPLEAAALHMGAGFWYATILNCTKTIVILWLFTQPEYQQLPFYYDQGNDYGRFFCRPVICH